LELRSAILTKTALDWYWQCSIRRTDACVSAVTVRCTSQPPLCLKFWVRDAVKLWCLQSYSLLMNFLSLLGIWELRVTIATLGASVYGVQTTKPVSVTVWSCILKYQFSSIHVRLFRPSQFHWTVTIHRL
jgi:hypothetical protein